MMIHFTFRDIQYNNFERLHNSNIIPEVGDMIHTNIIPKEAFQNSDSTTWKVASRVVDVVMNKYFILVKQEAF